MCLYALSPNITPEPGRYEYRFKGGGKARHQESVPQQLSLISRDDMNRIVFESQSSRDFIYFATMITSGTWITYMIYLFNNGLI